MPPNLRFRTGPSGPFGPEPSITVPTVSGLSASPRVPYPAGALAWVESLRRLFVLDRSATDAPVPGQLVAAPGGGLWRATRPWLGGANPWAHRADWYVDPVTGSLEGDGSAGDPVNTLAEVQARLEGMRVEQDTVINVLGNTDEIADFRSLAMSNPPARFRVDGLLGATTQLTATLTTYTAESNVTNEQVLMTSIDIPDWTPFVGMRGRFLDGPAANAVFWIGTENPAGAGVNVARTTRCNNTDTDYLLDTPNPGDTFVLETLPVVRAVWLPHRRGGSSSLVVPCLRSLEFAGEDWLEIGGDDSYIIGCKASSNVYQQTNVTHFYGCEFTGYVSCVVGDYVVFRATCNRGPLLLNGTGGFVTEEALVQGSYISCWGQVILIKGLGIFDSNTHGLWVVGRNVNCYIQTGGGVAGGVRGTGNVGFGIFAEEPGTLWTYAIKPVITGTAGDTSFRGVARAYAAVPFYDAANLCSLLT